MAKRSAEEAAAASAQAASAPPPGEGTPGIDSFAEDEIAALLKSEQAEASDGASAPPPAESIGASAAMLLQDLEEGMAGQGTPIPGDLHSFGLSCSMVDLSKKHQSRLGKHKRRSSWADKSFSASMKGSMEITLKDNLVFVSEAHFKWFKMQKVNAQLRFLIGQIAGPQQTPDVIARAAGNEEIHKQNVTRASDYLKLGYLSTLLPLAKAAPVEKKVEIGLVFLSLSQSMKTDIVSAFLQKRVEWGKTIPKGMWEDPGICALINEARRTLNLDS